MSNNIVSRRTLMKGVLGVAGAGVFPSLTDVTPLRAPRKAVSTTMQPLNVGQVDHCAFPSMTKLHDGSLMLVWRQAVTHFSTQSQIVAAYSYDNGASWENSQVLRQNPDYRDPCIALYKGMPYLTWFGANASNPAMGAAVCRMWAPERRLGVLPFEASCAPIVTLPDGSMGACYYGKKDGELLTTSFMTKSTDNGWSWPWKNRITNMIGAGIATPEPFLVVTPAGMTHMFFRWGENDGIGMISSPDSGATWPGGPRKILENATGRPSAFITSNGALIIAYRERPTKNAVMSVSYNDGATWSAPALLLAAPAGAQPVGMTYATMAEVEPGNVQCVVGMEDASGKSQLYGTTLML